MSTRASCASFLPYVRSQARLRYCWPRSSEHNVFLDNGYNGRVFELNRIGPSVDVFGTGPVTEEPHTPPVQIVSVDDRHTGLLFVMTAYQSPIEHPNTP